ncbi:MAG TPA: hypothetical protein VHD36_21980 [Pirellulales bacterium]|nr:hypothetical protein [Pirellulales bacterium]
MSHHNGSHSGGHHRDEQQWGLCKDCKWWQVEPDAKISGHSVGVCIEESLQEFRLRISGNGGCTMFLEGKPARAKGSSDKPPTKVAAR